jgi:hypothetical protein
MDNKTIVVDNNFFSRDWVSSFTSLESFKEAVATNDWLTSDVLELAYKIAKEDQPTITEATAKKKKD